MKQQGMVNIVKETLDIYIYYIMTFALIRNEITSRQSVFGRTIQAKPIRMFEKSSFTNWLKHLLKHLLDNSIFHCWNTKRSSFTAWFRNFNSSYCLRMIIIKTLTNFLDKFYFVLYFEICYCLIIYSSRF